MKGRKPKPTVLRLLDGTPGKVNQHEPQVNGDLHEPPEHFNDEQKEIWRYAIDHAPTGLLKTLDLSVLEVWTVACYFHREAAIKVAQTGQVVKSPAGYAVPNPYLSSMNRQAGIMLKAASEMGFTPTSRTRIKIEDQVTDENPFAKFAAGR